MDKTKLSLGIGVLYVYIYMVGRLVGWLLWRINLSRLFNAKSILYK